MSFSEYFSARSAYGNSLFKLIKNDFKKIHKNIWKKKLNEKLSSSVTLVTLQVLNSRRWLAGHMHSADTECVLWQKVLLDRAALERSLEDGWIDGQTKEVAMTMVLTVYKAPCQGLHMCCSLNPHNISQMSTRYQELWEQGQGCGSFFSISLLFT